MPLKQLTAAIALCTLAAGTALAQTSVSVPGNPPSVTAPVPGCNSFTQGEAKSRIEARGFSIPSPRNPWSGKAKREQEREIERSNLTVRAADFSWATVSLRNRSMFRGWGRITLEDGKTTNRYGV